MDYPHYHWGESSDPAAGLYFHEARVVGGLQQLQTACEHSSRSIEIKMSLRAYRY